MPTRKSWPNPCQTAVAYRKKLTRKTTKAPSTSADNRSIKGATLAMRTINSLILAGGLLACGTTFGGDLLQWQNNSLTYLWGKNFKVNPAIQQTVTFEHADGWKYGDNFIFVDKIFYQARKMPATARTPITVRSATPVVQQDLRPEGRVRPGQGCAAGDDLRVWRG